MPIGKIKSFNTKIKGAGKIIKTNEIFKAVILNTNQKNKTDSKTLEN